ncbi:MAG: GspE/PulE family protein [bacterium]
MISTITKKRLRLGDLLVSANKITEEQLQAALKDQKKIGGKLGSVLIKMGFIKEETLLKFLSWQLNVPVVDLNDIKINKEVISLLPEEVLKRYQLLPISKEGKVLSLAMTDPLDINAIDEVIRITRHEVEPVITTETDMRQALGKVFSNNTLLDQAIESLKEGSVEYVDDGAQNNVKVEELRVFSEDTPVIKFVNNLLIQANREGVSDLHIEPDEKILRIRFRIDGILHDVPAPPKKMEPFIISRIKIMAKMDIAQTRVPQDGRFGVKIDDKDIGLRVSTYPTVFGENVVIRMLDKSSSSYGIDGLGIAKEEQKTLASVMKKPYGFVLATGPTGSGKTTTLYALLNHVNSIEKNIITIEDPIEYHLSLIRQSQINPKAGLTFANGLRSILRQDPDIIMIGEIRDHETANIAIESSLTGHLVISTLHTNDAASAINRLIEIGNEPYLVSSSLTAVIGQRLIRTNCSKCKESFIPSDEFLEILGLTHLKNPRFYKGKGCDHCRHSGYKGRTVIAEILLMNDEIRKLAMKKASSSEVLEAAKKNGMRTMKDDAIAKALQGTININEALGVISLH